MKYGADVEVADLQFAHMSNNMHRVHPSLHQIQSFCADMTLVLNHEDNNMDIQNTRLTESVLHQEKRVHIQQRRKQLGPIKSQIQTQRGYHGDVSH
jgi:hypothetical protein